MTKKEIVELIEEMERVAYSDLEECEEFFGYDNCNTERARWAVLNRLKKAIKTGNKEYVRIDLV